MKKILWISRHTMTPDQLSDLKRVLDDTVEVAQFTETVKNVNDLKPFVDDADVICAVLPIDKLSELMDICGGKPVLQAKSSGYQRGRKSYPRTVRRKRSLPSSTMDGGACLRSRSGMRIFDRKRTYG